MKGLKIGLIAVLSAIVLGLCGTLAWGLENGGEFPTGVTYADMRLVLDEEVSLDGIERIDIRYDMNSNDVIFREGEGNTLRVREYANYEAKENEVSTVAVRGDTLEVVGKRRSAHTVRVFGFGYGSGYGYTEIWLPSAYQNALTVKTTSGDIQADMELALDGELSLASTSGDMTVQTVSASALTLTASSGSITGDRLCAADGAGAITIGTTSGDVGAGQLAGDTSIETTSGNVNVETIVGTFAGLASSGDITVGSVDGDAEASASSGCIKINGGGGAREISTSSGDILLEGVADAFDVRTTSGDAVIRAEKGAGYIETTSGNVRLTLPELTGKLEIQTTSGEVGVSLSENAVMEFEAKTASGGIDTFFDDSLSFSKRGDSAKGSVGSGAQRYAVVIGTSSGDVRITKY
ncbi:MAG: DUF4097 family beta strand repeat-containing protein [Roseburia sp.]|nr:DUF4097 family beta strand repeat-containing protein [Roseburia sp.]